MARSTILRARNNTGSTIAAGTVVYIYGYDDSNKQALIAPASNDSASTMPAVGVVREEVLDSAEAVIITVGQVGSIDTSSATANSPAYVGTGGTITFIKPTDSNTSAIVQQLGTVVKISDYPHGLIHVFPLEVTPQIKHDELIDVTETQHHNKVTVNVVGSGVSLFSGISDQLLEFKTLVPGTNVTLSDDGTRITISIPSFVLGAGNGAAGQVAFWTTSDTISGESNLFWDQTNNRLGINTSSPQDHLHVIGDSASATAKLRLQSFNSTGDTWISSYDENSSLRNIINLLDADASDRIRFWVQDQAQFILSINQSGQVEIGTTSTVGNEKVTLDGRLSLQETTAPTTTSGYGKIYVKSSDSKLYFMNDSGTEYDLTAGGSGTITGTGSNGRVTFWTGSSSISSDSLFFWDDTNNRLGIGIASPVTTLDVRGSSSTSILTVRDLASGGVVSIGSDGTSQTHLTMGTSGSIDGQNSQFQITSSASIPIVLFAGGSERIRADATTSRVGILESSPNDTLTVGASGILSLKEGVSPSDNTGYGKLFVKSSDSKLYFRNDSGTEYDLTATAGVSGSGANGRVTFWTGTSTVSSNANFFWDNTNTRLGIGNGAPGFPLQVNGSGHTIVATDGTVQVGFNLASTAGWVGTKTNHNLNFFTNDSSALMVLDTSGRFGIADSSPNEKLTVGGFVSLKEQGSSPTDTATYGKLFVKSADSALYFRNDSGIEFNLTTGGSGGGTDLSAINESLRDILKDLDGYADGYIVYTFEKGVMPDEFLQEGDLPWTVTTLRAFNGIYSARSGAIGSNQSTKMSLMVDFGLGDIGGGQVKFFRKVSSESGFDILRFFIDDVELLNISGNIDWTESSFDVQPGIHKLTWLYSKDGAVNTGDDAAFIDDLRIYGAQSINPIVSTPTITGDGYMAFFVRNNVISGDSDVFFDRANNRLGIHNTAPNEMLTVGNTTLGDGGLISIAETTLTPGINSGYGKVYVKSADSNLYFMNDSGAEFDLTAADVRYALDGYIDGYMLYNFEDGVIPPEFEMGGNLGWTVATNSTRSGFYSARSGAIGGNQSSSMSLRVDFGNGYGGKRQVVFWRRTSSESGFDILRFFIDGVEHGNWSGALEWDIFAFDVQPGVHLLTWHYSKDGAVNTGEDTVYIDDLKLIGAREINPVKIASATGGADGYIAFFTNAFSIAGDNDLFLDRVNSKLGIYNTSPNEMLTIGNIAQEVGGVISLAEVGEGHIPGTTSNFGKLYVKASDSDLYFKDDSGVEYNLTTVVNKADAYIAYDFEKGLIPPEFETGGNLPWITTTFSVNTGTYAIRSGAISGNQTSTISLRVHFGFGIARKAISFFRRTSSESGFDILKFYVDGTVVDQWSGSTAWSEVTYDIPPGIHLFTWEYSKDGAANVGEDTVYIDDIKLYGAIDINPIAAAGITVAGDGYLAFFTGTNTIAGDNDLFLDRTHSRLGIRNSSPNEPLTIGSGNAGGVISLNEVAEIPTNTSGYGKVYVKSSDSALYFQNDSGTEYNLTAGASGLTATQSADGYLAFFTGTSTVAGDNDLFWERDTNRLRVDGYIYPNTDNVHDLGKPDKRWQSLYLGPGSLHLVSTAAETITSYQWSIGIETTNSSGQLIITQGQNRFLTIDPITGRVGFGNNTSPNEAMTVEGVLSLRETTSPSDNPNYGKLFVKASDSKIYFRNDSGTEYDLTAGGLSASQAFDGYLTFFTSSSTIAGDNDLYWDRVNNRLGLHNESPNESLTIGSGNAGGVISLNEISELPTNTANFGKLYVKASDSKLYFQNDSGTEYDLTVSTDPGLAQTEAEHYQQTSEAIQTILKDLDGYLSTSSAVSETDGFNGADGYVAFFTGDGRVAGDNDLFFDRVNNLLYANMDFGVWGSPPFTILLTSGTSYNFDSAGVVKIWLVGGGGGGAGTAASDGVAGGGGGAGGVVYKTFAVSGSQTITYSLGTGGTGSSSGTNGNAGGTSTADFQSITLTANGGSGGNYNSTSSASGGSFSGGDGGATGGTGGGSDGDSGGGGGGGIGTANKVDINSSNGQDGAQSNDVSGLQAAAADAGYSWTTFGAGSTSSSPNNSNGGSATGVGCGGGGGSYWGGNGGNGFLGGGGAGAGGYSNTHSGGNGGNGFILIKTTFA